MRFGSLLEELDAITKDYDYGIVPGSAAVFVKDEIMGIGRLDMTLLEGVMIVIELSDKGFMIASCTPLTDDSNTLEAAERIQEFVDKRWFETMEDLLMTASPLFQQRFQATLYNKLQQAQQHQIDHDGSLTSDLTSIHPSSASPTFYSLQSSSPTMSPGFVASSCVSGDPAFPSHDDTSTQRQDFIDELNQWIH
ncbi:hypothetical protein DM01DRAFT_1325612 [Hesseltinella vesiculosa]|uniref:GSKIP domain-containing protein n=1 Tax=Hesseltinella vesiculosa TaxID=101127 RepID=A0A1X2GAW8_9FUNG|nr:hypothetical protein DM01DRAFT_1325612 [Hesseltinella vesiculosa]